MECSFGLVMAENNDVKADELFMKKEEVFKVWEEDMNAFEKYFKERFPKLKARCSEEDIDKLNNMVYRTTTKPLSKSASTCVCVTFDSSLTSFSSLRSYDFWILRLL